MNNFAIGIDIGGSHISTALVSLHTGLVLSNTVQRCIISPCTDLQGFMDALLKSIDASCAVKEDFSINAIGFAFPGPFNYERGICEIEGVEKMDHLFAADIRTCCHNLLYHRFRISYKAIQFINDAQAFLLGVVAQEKLEARTAIGITVGTGIGSAFFKNGRILEKDENIPASGYLYNTPYCDGIVEDYISTRWFLKRYKARNVEEIAVEADKGDPHAIELFQAFAIHLARIICPWIKKFKAEVLILGGGIFNAWHLINTTLLSELRDKNIQIDILINNNTDIMNINGAVKNTMGQGQTITPCRKTEQYLLPVNMPEKAADEYDIYPACPLVEGNIYHTLEKLVSFLPDNGNIVIDGYGGIFWDQFIADLAVAFADRQVQTFWYNIDTALKPAASINELIAPYLNNDGPASIFGKRYPGNLQDFFDQEKLRKIKPSEKGLNIIYGTGAALAGWNGVHIYIDIPKNEIQFRSRAGTITNLGDNTKPDASAQYKRFYFIDWPVLNTHKQALLSQVDFIIDGQQTSLYPFTTGMAFRNTLSYLSRHSFRARPWFEPGVWGGNWMKKKITSLPQDVPNYAWSFELITPENGLLFEDKGRLLEISFDWLMFAHAPGVLGKAYNKFGTYFPIRFDYLDTFDGDNLSVQCHPSLSYAQQNFGELVTQDETYYILDQKESAGVYIGFTSDTDPISFEAALRQSQQTKQPMEVAKHVQFIPSKKHDLFLIPNKTVHCSGINNLVLEISSTPYIFTFKLYDWVRPDLNGNLRPINIGHGMQNLDFSRKGDVVLKELISSPVILQQSVNYIHWHLPTHPDHFYDVERYEWEGTIDISTRGQCHILSLVEGSRYRVTINDQSIIYNYAETIIIPAAAEKYSITYLSAGKGKLIKAFVKDDFCN